MYGGEITGLKGTERKKEITTTAITISVNVNVMSTIHITIKLP